MSDALGFNSTDAPLVVDGDGRTIGGGEWGVIDTLDEHTKPLLADGQLVKVPDIEDEGSADPRAVLAQRALTAKREQKAAAKAADKRSRQTTGSDRSGDSSTTSKEN